MDTHKQASLKSFTRPAEPFSALPAHRRPDALELMIRTTGVDREDRVLDVACGSGIVTCAFAEKTAHATGVDLTPAMLQKARALGRDKNLKNISWETGDAEKLRHDSGAFSIVVTQFSFHRFEYPERVLAEMLRVTRLGGTLMVTDFLRAPSNRQALTLEELASLMKNAGIINLRRVFYGMERGPEEIPAVILAGEKAPRHPARSEAK